MEQGQPKRTKVTLVLDVLDEKPLGEVEGSVGLITRLRHPKLDGTLSFIHSPNGGREEYLKALDENVFSSVLDAAFTIKNLVDNTKKTNVTTP